jgi:hypothetical protein
VGAAIVSRQGPGVMAPCSEKEIEMSGRYRLMVVVLACGLLLVAGISLLSSSTAGAQEGAKYVGSEKCKMCHAEQHAGWLESKHSKAWESLTPEQVASGKHGERACVECHVTGFGKPNGFVSAEKTPELEGVGCENCHGPGGNHMKVMMAAAMNEEEVAEKQIQKDAGCTQCHNPHVNFKKLYGAK